MSGESTKVYYYFEDKTPYLSTVPVPADRITLGDFKKVFNRRGYKYYYQVFDDVIKCKAWHEILHDHEKLVPNAKGLFELHLQQIAPSGTLQRAAKNRANGLFDDHYGQGSSICDDFDARGGQRVSMVTADKSSVGSFISKRAGEQLADLCTSEEDAYRLDENSTTYTEESSDYRLVHDRNRAAWGGRKNRYRRPYVPSTICSASESSYSLPALTEVKLNLKDLPLGLLFVSLEDGIFIGEIQPGSAGERCQVLEVGDQVIQVDNTSFENLSPEQCLNVLKRVAAEKREMAMVVAKRTSDRRSETLSAMHETMGVDISLWVETTKQPGVEAAGFEAPNVETASAGGHSTSDEERAAYEDRRNGIGAHFVPIVKTARQHPPPQQHHLLNQAAAHPLQPQSLPLRNPNGRPLIPEQDEESEKTMLSVNDTPLLIVQCMARPNSGLMVKDRKWLKIPIPMSFIGHELVNWLLERVHGFENRKQAHAFATRLLELGLIKHAVKMSRFSEKCYYKFDDKISAERQRLEQQAAKANGESPTEITYMSGPTSPRQKRAMQPAIVQTDGIRPTVPPNPAAANTYLSLRPHVPPPHQNGAGVSKTTAMNLTEEMPSALNVWPVSPILGPRNGRPFVRDCESPAMTNDYASMIHVDAVGPPAVVQDVALHSMPRIHPMHERKAIPTSTFASAPTRCTRRTTTAPLQLQQSHVLHPAVVPKLRSLSPPPPNTPNTVNLFDVQ
ncbi:hypothetical protein M3Y99_01574400 [Aphelenchoides fujianensis]|nr:hypothetical protein M3Y99_01574400 [Aphelenchoides fujianensis]